MYVLIAGINTLGIHETNTSYIMQETILQKAAKNLAHQHPDEEISIFKLEKKWLPKVTVEFAKYIINNKNEILPE